MLHRGRPCGIVTVKSMDALVENLTRHTWTRCTGFPYQGLLSLNDSTAADGAQEYAARRAGRQIESLTVSWMSQAEAWSDIDWLVHGDGGD